MFDKALIPALAKLRMPERYSADRVADGLRVTRLTSQTREVAATFEAYRSRGPTCRRLRAATEEGEALILEFATFDEDYGVDVAGVIHARRHIVEGEVLCLDNARFRDPSPTLPAIADMREQARVAWTEGIAYTSEQADRDRGVVRLGLRLPQAGALHAIAAHWTLGGEPAIVVMPTGTGKTEVMIAAAVASACDRLLVIVPTDALREQTASKFQTYGLLRQIGVVGDLPPPVVGILSSRPIPDQFEALRACNVVVTTMSSIGLADDAVQEAFAALFSHAFFDEAHHIEATTWKRFQQHCPDRPALLFTATPFRKDSKPIEGKIIYNFPLGQAQAHGYFNAIRYAEVFEPDEQLADRAIAETAVAQLRQDLAAGYDHILMARADKIDTARNLFERIYRPLYADLTPVLIHSRTPGRRQVVEAIRGGRHKIIVCVDMFGEGFDLPTLKIAALHSVHKSLGITLQFIGRFARTAAGVGPATFVANAAEDGVPEALESLYQEDANWNLLIADFSYDAIDPQARLSELVANLEPVGLDEEEIEISTLALRPKISAQIYRTTEFHPGRFARAFGANQRIYQPQISRIDNILVLIVNQREQIDWTNSRQIVLDSWDLYIAYFDPVANLLYTHCSRKGDSTTKLARAIARDPVLIQGEDTFKAFAALRRLILHSVGLTSRSRNVRYQMFAGLDVRNAIDPVQQASKMKSNVMGVGYEEGVRNSIGCSRKGKIWSMASGSLAQWKMWCDKVGAKLSNPDTQPDDFLRYTLIPTIVDALPQARALMVDWPDQLFESANFRFQVSWGERAFDFHDCELGLVEWQEGESFTFSLRAGEEVEIRLLLRIEPQGENESTFTVQLVAGANVEIEAVGQRLDAAGFFTANPPLVRLENGAQLSGNILLQPQEEIGELFDRDALQSLDWTGIDLAKESRWRGGQIRNDSIQQRFIEHLEEGSATFIIDDDDQGEAADIVAIEETPDAITVYLWHCKYSGAALPGRRADDLYEVCGQAQKSIKWTWILNRLIQHLIIRETKHARGRGSRFIRGSTQNLATVRKGARRKFVGFRIGIVQPGLSRAGIPNDHLAIIGSTSSLVQTITDNRLLVYGSE